MKCQDDLLFEGEEPCAPMNEINEWLETKQLFLKVIDNKIDFNSYEKMALRQTEKWMPMVTMSPGHFSDTGYRFRRNFFVRNDDWVPFIGSEN